MAAFLKGARRLLQAGEAPGAKMKFVNVQNVVMEEGV